MREIKVGIIGFGTVGAGVAENLLLNGDVITKRIGVKVTLAGIADLDITSDRGVAVPRELLTTDAAGLIEKSDVVVELIGGTGAAKKFILQALRAGKSVVTANKALLAMHGEELFRVAEENGADICYEASVAGGIPILKALREGLVSNRINRIYGILNGTCNYILTRMEREGIGFEEVLVDAQRLGYAEAEPSLDIDGYDTAHKAAILAGLAYGRWFGLDPVHVEGIRGVSLDDLRYADGLGYRIKLLAVLKNNNGVVEVRVHPTLIPKNALLANISDVFNGVMVEGDTVGQTLFYGRGAGRAATASAVVADIADVALNIDRGCPRRVTFRAADQFREVAAFEDTQSRYYLRVQVRDTVGIMASVTRILADHGISICSLIQPENNAGEAESVPLVILTHKAVEKALDAALAEIENLTPVCGKVKLFRIEDL